MALFGNKEDEKIIDTSEPLRSQVRQRLRTSAIAKLQRGQDADQLTDAERQAIGIDPWDGPTI